MGHGHYHTTEEINSKLKISILLNAIIIVVQVVGGIIANSLGLLSDAGHNFTDLGALVLSWFALSQTLKPATSRKTFGYHRAGVLAALANSAALILITGVILFESVQRIQSPEPIEGGLTFIIATIAFLANTVSAIILRGPAHENINVRSSFIHMVGDALVSLGVMIAAAVIFYTDLFIIDPIISIAIGVVIAISAWQIIDESVHILLEGTPHGVNVDEVLSAIINVKGVRDVHDLHIWALGTHVNALSCHLLVEDMKIGESATILNDINMVLCKDFGISHTTMQFESTFCETNYLYCDLISQKKVPKETDDHSGHSH